MEVYYFSEWFLRFILWFVEKSGYLSYFLLLLIQWVIYLACFIFMVSLQPHICIIFKLKARFITILVLSFSSSV